MKFIYIPVLFLLCFVVNGLTQPGLLIAVQQYPDSVAIVNLDDDKVIAQLPTGFMPHELCYDSITKVCFISDFGVEDYDNRSGKPGNSITILDPFQQKILGKIFTSMDTLANCPHGIKLRPGSWRELFVNIEIGDSMLIFDPQKFTRLRGFPVPKLTHNFVFSPDGERLWAFAGPDGVYELDPGDGRIVHHQKLNSPIRGLALINNDLLASGKDEIYILSHTDLSIKKHFTNLGVGQVFYSCATKDGKLIIAPAALDDVVLIIDAETGKILHRLNTGKAAVNIQVTDDAAYISQALDDHVSKIDLKTFKVYNDIKLNGTNGLLVIPAQ